VEVLPNFLDERFGMNSNASPISGQGYSLLSVGGPSHAKGTDVLLQALARMSGPVRLSVVGQGAELPFFQRMAQELGVAKRVRWLGALAPEGMSAVYQAADALVLPSRGETFGMVLIEALAHGKPVIATLCGGPEDIVHAGNGLLVPVADAQALAAAMEHMRSACSRFDPNALRADVLGRFGAVAAAARLESWYRSLIDGFQTHGRR
jgi:glycosyltransferase involved in cell wall biosynthesis